MKKDFVSHRVMCHFSVANCTLGKIFLKFREVELPLFFWEGGA